MINTTQNWKIGDCLDLMKEMEPDSVDLAIIDPPYYKIITDEWDHQWETFNKYLDWIEIIAINIKRILKPNGSFLIFGDDHRIAYIQVRLDKHFSFLNHLIWYKRNNQSIKGIMNFRRYACVSERILFYEQKSTTGLPTTGLHEIYSNVDNFKPIKDYMRREYQKVMDANGFTRKVECDEYLNKITNTKSIVTRHYFADSQYCFPTLELYTKLHTSGFFQRPYESLREEYESLRRTFNPEKKMHEVFDIPIIGGKENLQHPTQKPLKLIESFIKNTTNENNLVLDPFLGSGTTLEACRNTNRNCIGFEISNEWEQYYSKRCMKNIPQLDKWF